MDTAANKPTSVDSDLWGVLYQHFWRQLTHAVAADIVLERHRAVESGGAKHQRIHHFGVRGNTGICSLRVLGGILARGRHRQFFWQFLPDDQLHHHPNLLFCALHVGVVRHAIHNLFGGQQPRHGRRTSLPRNAVRDRLLHVRSDNDLHQPGGDSQPFERELERTLHLWVKQHQFAQHRRHQLHHN